MKKMRIAGVRRPLTREHLREMNLSACCPECRGNGPDDEELGMDWPEPEEFKAGIYCAVCTGRLSQPTTQVALLCGSERSSNS